MAILVQKGHAYFIKVSIPRRLRHLFLGESGKPRGSIWEKAGSDYSAAKVACSQRGAWWDSAFARLERGETLADIERDAVELRRVQQWMQMRRREIEAGRFVPHPPTARLIGEQFLFEAGAPIPVLTAPAPVASETVSQAATALFDAMARDGRRQTTIDGHKLRVRAFIGDCGDIPLANITRAMASDWLDKIGAERSNRTRNAYGMTMALVIETARKRGRFTGENPFDGMKVKAAGSSYEPFTTAELHKLLAALPCEIRPAKHTPESALPWVVRIAAYSGMRLEEICQLTVADIQMKGSNGGTVIVFDIHNGDDAHKLKNESSARAVPLHSEIVRAGLLDYAKALPKNGPLFPGLKRRASKGGKIGARIGELFRKKLIALGLKRAGLVFHSLRHNAATALEQAGVSASDTARLLGHAVAGESFGTYSSGPGLARLKATVEEIHYDNI